MASVNKVILVGNLGRDPDIRYTPDGAAICNVSLATTSSWKDKNSGERREETEWHRLVFFNRLAEIAGQYLRKGSPVYVEGRLRTRKWQDKDSGQDRYTTEITVDQMQMLGGRDAAGASAEGSGAGGAASGSYGGTEYGSTRGARAQTPAASPAPAAANLADMDDDVPF